MVFDPSSLRPPLAQKKLIWFAALSTFSYFLVFAAMTFPSIFYFSSHYFADDGDGFQNVWNIWWVNKAVTELNQLPWFTRFLYAPHGTSLLAHTLNPFNGFVCIPLLRFLSLVQAHNFIVIFSFVMGGLTAFALAWFLTRRYWVGWFAGFVFTFSNFHFAHAEGHLQLVSLEWLPAFVLAWLMLLEKPSSGRALFAASMGFLVLLCDYYYFFYCGITALILLVYEGRMRRDPLFFARGGSAKPFLVFVVTSTVLCGPLVVGLTSLANENFTGSHDPAAFSADLFGYLIPGGHWRFNYLTHFFWRRLPGNVHESSVYLGFGGVILLVRGWTGRGLASRRDPLAATAWVSHSDFRRAEFGTSPSCLVPEGAVRPIALFAIGTGLSPITTFGLPSADGRDGGSFRWNFHIARVGGFAPG